MDDARAEQLLEQVLTLAVTLRAESEAVLRALADVDDPRSALVVAAALIDIDRPVDAWWQRDPPTQLCVRCGQAPHVGRSPYCAPCRLAARRHSWRDAARRRRDAGADPMVTS